MASFDTTWNEHPRQFIVQGRPRVRQRLPVDLTAQLRAAAGALRFQVLHEMDEYLASRNAPARDVPELPEFCRIYTEESNPFDVIARINGDPTLGPIIDRIEPDFALSLAGPSAQIGTSFDLRASGASHRDYCSDLNVHGAHAAGLDGSGVRVAVIDSGAEPYLVNDFSDLYGYPTSATAVDGFGHGTAMASIIKSVAPGVTIHAIRVTDSGNVYLWDVMAAVKTALFSATMPAADIVNISLGCRQTNLSCSQCGGTRNRSDVFEGYLDLIHRLKGVPGQPDAVIMAAVGNEGPDANGNHTEFEWPARYTTVLAAGAIDHNFALSSFSNAGTQKYEYCLCPGGQWDYATNTATEWIGEGSDGGNPTYCVGTSAATAYASGLVALYREHFVNVLRSGGGASAVPSSAKLLDEVYKRCVSLPGYNAALHGAGRLVFDANPPAGASSGNP
ncbi:S8 family peptidase [Paraburkholderia terrae]